MKKLLFVLAFTFIGQQSFSQMYMVSLTTISSSHPSGLDQSNDDGVITVIDPAGNATHTYLENLYASTDPSNLIK